MNAEVLNVLTLGGLPLLGWLVVVGPLLFQATLGASEQERQQGVQDRLQLVRFFGAMAGMSGLVIGAFLLVRVIR